MDNVNDPNLIFNSDGVCNHCLNFDDAFKRIPKGKDAELFFVNTIRQIKEAGEGERYDCIIGISGGLDSTYLCYVAKQQGLRPLLVHCDNGWNSELAVKNIENICTQTGYDLYTHVIDWEEMRDIQLSFFKAGVVDIELPYDYALITTSYKAAQKYHIKHVLTGHNIITEGTYLPKLWRHKKTDVVNIKAIHKRFGKLPLRTFPSYNFFKQRLIDKQLKYVYLLNYIPYNKKEVKEIVKHYFGWKDYGGKHDENVFTRFYQKYILKEKFGFDKRQFHLSVLVQSGQLTRGEAIYEYSLPAYDSELFKTDREFVLKKLGFSEKTFEEYMKAPIKRHEDYPSIETYWDMYFRTVKFLKPFINFARRITKPFK